MTEPLPIEQAWIVRKVPVDRSWLADGGRVRVMVNLARTLTPDDARRWAALYLAAADAAEKAS